MKRQTGIGLTIAVGVALVAIVLWLPRKSADAEKLISSFPLKQLTEVDDPVEAAVQKVSSENPDGGYSCLCVHWLKPNRPTWMRWCGWESLASKAANWIRHVNAFRKRIDIGAGLTSKQPGSLAMLDMEEGAYDRAVVGFETVMGEDSTYANGLFFTARCYEAMGKTEAALIRYNEYLPYAPDTVVANRVQDFITRLEFGTPAGTNE